MYLPSFPLFHLKLPTPPLCFAMAMRGKVSMSIHGLTKRYTVNTDENRIVACIRVMMLGLFSVQLAIVAVCVQLICGCCSPVLLAAEGRFRGCGICCVWALCSTFIYSILCTLASSHTFSYNIIYLCCVSVLAYNSLCPAYVACFLPFLSFFPPSSLTHITFIASLDLCVLSWSPTTTFKVPPLYQHFFFFSLFCSFVWFEDIV